MQVKIYLKERNYFLKVYGFFKVLFTVQKALFFCAAQIRHETNDVCGARQTATVFFFLVLLLSRVT